MMTGRKRKTLRVIGIILVIIFIILAAGLIFGSRGLSEMQKLVINDVDLTKISDGVYTGEFSLYRWSNTVKVTIKNHKITAIQAADRQNLHDELSNRIIAQQTLQIDAVSGATVSSKAFLKAIENALSN